MQEELERMQEGIKELEEEMSRIKAMLDEKTKEVEEAKRAASKAAKALEQAQKEISSRVGCFAQCHWLCNSLWTDGEFETRTTKLRGLGSSVQAYIVNAASRRSSYRWSRGISRASLWRRFVIQLSWHTLL
jgi:cell division septum initiation protein DivIVA